MHRTQRRTDEKAILLLLTRSTFHGSTNENKPFPSNVSDPHPRVCESYLTTRVRLDILEIRPDSKRRMHNLLRLQAPMPVRRAIVECNLIVIIEFQPSMRHQWSVSDRLLPVIILIPLHHKRHHTLWLLQGSLKTTATNGKRSGAQPLRHTSSCSRRRHRLYWAKFALVAERVHL